MLIIVLFFIAEDPKRYVGEKAAQPFMDEQVVVYDCIERLKGYNFVGIVDFDEFVYSRISHKHNLKGMLVNHYCRANQE